MDVGRSLRQNTPGIEQENIVLSLEALRALAAIANAIKQRLNEQTAGSHSADSGPEERGRAGEPSSGGNCRPDPAGSKTGERGAETKAEDPKGSSCEFKTVTADGRSLER